MVAIVSNVILEIIFIGLQQFKLLGLKINNWFFIFMVNTLDGKNTRNFCWAI
jgi:hypothetical protein